MSEVIKIEPNQFHHENRGWIRLLDFFKQENTILKNRLAEAVDHSSDKEFLVMAEQFQNKFIIKDEFIDELRHDVNELDLKLAQQQSGFPDRVLLGKLTKLRNEMEFFEKDFYRLIHDFNAYFLKIANH